MKLSVLTLFPELIAAAVGSSITGRALASGLFQLNLVQIRDFAVNSYGKVDDYRYGGGTGMVMMAEPVYQAWQAAGPRQAGLRTRTISLSPRGQVFNQAAAKRLVAGYDHLILLCGHYEGIDQRVLDEIVDEEISIGDYVLTGGELPACVLIDAVLRLLPGVLPQEAYLQESHMAGLLEHAQYTRPATWQSKAVPDVLLSGHQANIDQWQEMDSLLTTLRERPDLFWENNLPAEKWLDVILFYQEQIREKQEKQEKQEKKQDG